MATPSDHGLQSAHKQPYIDIQDGPTIPQDYVDLDYGTCGYRGLVDTPPNHLDHVVYRCGVLMATLPFLRDPETLYHRDNVPHEAEDTAYSEQHILSAGVVITASHNPAGENGIKLLEANGNMLTAAWETEFTKLVNYRGKLAHEVARILDKYRLGPVRLNNTHYIILIGYDTRASSPHLAALFTQGVRAMAHALKLQATTCVELGTVTTPTVGFLLNNSMLHAVNDEPYIQAVKEAFYACLASLIELGHMKRATKADPHISLFYDCSYGVGGCVVYKFFDCLRDIAIIPHICHSPIWMDEHSKHMLNNGCGTNYVLTQKRPPAKIEEKITLYEGKWFCAFDGDADRLLYFTPHQGSIKIIDGVRLLVVKMRFIAFALRKIKKSTLHNINIAVMINHYANGAAINYIKKLMKKWNTVDSEVNWTMELCRVGIKNMQEKHNKYDISIFYEVNGHGNLVFNNDCILFRHGEQCAYRRLLANIARMFRSPIGDAITNSLFIQLAMRVMRLTYDDVMQLYQEMPCVNATVSIPSSKRTYFRTKAENDTILEQPAELQRMVEEATQGVKGARAFIRPSGTESLCRIYAEAPSQDQANKLGEEIATYIAQFIEKT